MRLQDEQLLRDAPNFWDADGVEVYFDVAARTAGGAPATGVTERFRIELLPFNAGRRFGVITWANRRVLGPGGLAGVEVASREREEGVGAYDVEARLPLASLGIDPVAMRSVRFELAVRDRDTGDKPDPDGGPPERATLSFSGRSDLSPEAGPLPTLRFDGTPPRAAAGSAGSVAGRWWLGVLVPLLLLGLLWGVGRSARRVHRAIHPRFPRWRTIGLLGCAAVTGLLAFGPVLFDAATSWRAGAGLRARSDGLREALEQLSTPEISVRLRGADDAALRDLLRGQPLRTPEANRFEQIDVMSPTVTGPGEYRSLDPIPGVPFHEYGVRLDGTRDGSGVDGSFDLVLPRPERARRVHLSLASFLPDASRRDQLINGVEVHLQFANRSPASAKVTFLTIDDARGEPIGHDKRPWGVATLRNGRSSVRDGPWLATEVGGREIRHLDHYVIEVDLPADPANPARDPELARLTITPTARATDAILWISGITLERGTGTPDYLPLSLGSVDPNGFPMAMRGGRPAPRELRVVAKPGTEPTRALLFGRGESDVLELLRLRIYYRAEGAVLRALADAANLKVRAWVLVTLEGRDAPLRFPLRAGIEIDDAQLYGEPQHPASMTSFLASTFETLDGLVYHYDGYELPLETAIGTKGPYRVRRIEIEQPPETRGALIVAGVTASVRDKPAPLPRLSHLQVEGDQLSLAPDVTTLLEDPAAGVSFAVARDQVLTQFGAGLAPELVDRLRGTRIPTSLAASGLVVREETRAGRRFLTTALDCGVGGGSFQVVLLHEIPGLEALRSVRDATALIAGLLALPFVLLLLVDALARIARIRIRLSLLFLLTSLAPLAVLFVVLFNILSSEQRRAEQRRSEEIVGQVRERIERLADLASDHAVRVLKALEDSEMLSRPVGDENVRIQLAQWAQGFPDRDASVEIMVEVPGEGDAARRIHSSPLRTADPRFDAPNVGLARSWGALVFSGAASSARRNLKVQVAGLVDERALKPLRMDPAEDESVALLTPLVRRGSEELEGGETLAGTRLGRRVDATAARAAARELDGGRGLFFADSGGVGTVGFDLVRRAGGDPVAIVAAAIGARPLRVDFGFASIELPWFVLALSAVILGASLFLGSVVTEGITRPLARLLRGAVEHAARSALPPESGGDVPDAEDEVASLELSFRRLSDELARRERQQELMVGLVTAMGVPADLRDRAWRALDFVHQLVGGAAVACYVWEPADAAWVLVAHRGTSSTASDFPHRLTGTGAHAIAAEERRARWVSRPAAGEGTEATDVELLGEAPAVLLLPLERGGRTLGIVVARLDTAADPLASLDVVFVAGLLAQVAAGLENARLEARTIEDPETGLYVHAHFTSRVAEEIDRAAHQGRPLALLLLRWKLESGGGDPRDVERRVAGLLARELRRACREREVVARATGLEFEVLAPYGGRARVDEVAQVVRARLADPQVWGGDIPPGRLQVASASFPDDARSSDYLFGVLRRRLDAEPEAAVAASGEDLATRFQRRFPELGFGSARMQPILRQIEKVATSDATVLILGETGTGKEVAAHLLHRLSGRGHQPFVAVHCAALPEKLLESELFGAEKGAFTGADQRRLGRFEQAHGGTLFLDEVGEIPVSVQVKLLRVLQERKVQRLGGGEEIPVDVRVVAATHQSLERRVIDGHFREDLYYRLKVVTLELPPLRERLDEIPQLVDRFIAAKRANEPSCLVRRIEPAALDLLGRHHWPGNVRELRNVIERAIVLGNSEAIRKEDIEFSPASLQEGRPAVVAGPPTPASAPAAAAVPSRITLGSPDPPEGLTERQRRLLQTIREQGTITTRGYCETSGVPRRTALRDLAELVERGLLTRSGVRKAASYRLAVPADTVR